MTARKLANALEGEGWTVWWDPKLRAGERFNDVIEKALKESKCIVVMWSKRSVESLYVKDEATYALNRNKLVPVMIEEVELPFRFEGLHTPSLLEWDGSDDAPGFRRLVEDITAIVGPPTTVAKRKADGEKERNRTQQKPRAQRTAEKEHLREQERQWSEEEARRNVDDEDNPRSIEEQREGIASRLIDYMADEFEKKHGMDLRKESLALQRLKVAAEKAMSELSTVQQTEVNLPFITADSKGPKHLEMKLTHAKLESLVAQRG